jgi:hypothetical protein
MDGLFAGGPTFDLCRRYGWKFMIVLKDDDLPSVNEEFNALSKLQTENRLAWRTGKEAQIKQVFRWVDDIAYVDSLKKEHTLSAIECLETKPDKEGQKKTTKFKWVTNCHVSCKNVTTLSNDGGRMRWKIENEGFNVQKKGGYELEHAYTNNPNSAKVFYLLLQIAHLLAQLLYKATLLKRDFPGGFGSAKNLASRLLEAWRNAPMAQSDITTTLQKRFQIRFDSSSSTCCSSPPLPDNLNSHYDPIPRITVPLSPSPRLSSPQEPLARILRSPPPPDSSLLLQIKVS